MDRITSETRSANMRAIRSKDMKPEMAVRKLVHSLGYRYRLHRKGLPGKPDLAFPHAARLFSCMGASGTSTTARAERGLRSRDGTIGSRSSDATSNATQGTRSPAVQENAACSSTWSPRHSSDSNDSGSNRIELFRRSGLKPSTRYLRSTRIPNENPRRRWSSASTASAPQRYGPSRAGPKP